ncbi:MAG: hypothetical protein WC054_05480 [Candidatus Nanopelagicales bacterium]
MKREAFQQFSDTILQAFATGRLVAIDGHRVQREPQPALTLFPKGVGR